MNLAEQLLAHPSDRRALTTPDGSLTYGELADLVARWRGGLGEAGVGPGDRVVVVAGNDAVFVAAHLATIGCGAALVPLNPASPPAELARELVALDAAGAIVAPSAEQVWDSIDPEARPRRLVHTDFAAAAPRPVTPVDPETVAALLHTSGTAGMPKPAILTHGNVAASLRSVESLDIDLRSDPQVVAAVIPLFHVFGFNAVVNLGLAIGAELVVEDYRGPERIADLVAAHGVTILAGPPTLWQALAAAPALDRSAFGSVTLALSGAAKLAPTVRVAVEETLGLDIDEGYGLTETCAMVATSVGTDAPIGSVGRLLPGVEGRLVDPEGADVLVGDPGELWVRGPMVSPGYLGEDTAGSRTDDGWLRTGDLAVVDDGGHLAIVDRLKDIVIVSGFNVFPGEVEAALLRHPDVVEAGVVGRPDERTGEALVAHVVALAGSDLDLEDLDRHCRAELARYKVPSQFEVRDRLPVGIAGKLRRRELG